MEDEFRRPSFAGGFYRVIVKGLNIIAWATLGIIAIGIVIAYVTDHQITIIHNENPPAASTPEPSPLFAPTVAPVGAGNKSGG